MEKLKISAIPENLHSPFPLINSVINLLQDGNIYSEGDTFFIFHKSGFSYLIAKDNVDYSAILKFLLQSKELPGYFHIYEAPPGLVAECSSNPENVKIKLRKRIQLKFADSQLIPGNILPSDYALERIDFSSLEKLAEFKLSLENRFWRSESDFLTNGFGFTVDNEFGSPVSICYSACVSDNVAEIDVTTLPEYRGRGLAKLAVSRFVSHCLENGIIANWDCFEDNYMSLRTAESIGFKHMFSYDFLSIFNKKRNS